MTDGDDRREVEVEITLYPDTPPGLPDEVEVEMFLNPETPEEFLEIESDTLQSKTFTWDETVHRFGLLADILRNGDDGGSDDFRVDETVY